MSLTHEQDHPWIASRAFNDYTDFSDYTDADTRKQYAVKCDDCKVEIRRTDNVQESYAGGQCATCSKNGVFR